MFKNRIDAAQQLAQALEPYRNTQPLVLGIARGAVPMAATIAAMLHTDWDVLLAKKLGAPANPEFAIGAIDESGWLYRSQISNQFEVDVGYLLEQKSQQMALMANRRAQYDAIAPQVMRTGRTVIVVDDGLATGATMMAALHGLRQQGALKIICAVPIGSKQSLALARSVADEVICLSVPAEFFSVSQGYSEFEQVQDSQVLDLLSSKVQPD